MTQYPSFPINTDAMNLNNKIYIWKLKQRFGLKNEKKSFLKIEKETSIRMLKTILIWKLKNGLYLKIVANFRRWTTIPASRPTSWPRVRSPTPSPTSGKWSGSRAQWWLSCSPSWTRTGSRCATDTGRRRVLNNTTFTRYRWFWGFFPWPINAEKVHLCLYLIIVSGNKFC